MSKVIKNKHLMFSHRHLSASNDVAFNLFKISPDLKRSKQTTLENVAEEKYSKENKSKYSSCYFQVYLFLSQMLSLVNCVRHRC